MKKIYLFLFQAAFVTGISFAQQPNTDYLHCGTTEAMEALKKDPKAAASIEASRAQLEAFTENYIKNVYNPNEKSAAYVIPVVFHIIHTGGPENISDAQVLDAIDMMNLDYSKSNTDVGNTIPEFQAIVADCQIQFKLAKKDKDGNCTNGITRTFDNSTNTGNGGDQVAAVQADQGNWPGNMYLNIFVVANCGGAAGYSTYPSNWSATSMSNGIFILSNYVGSIGTSNQLVRHALSHEAGHWLNLSHCWGDNNSPGDPSSCSIDDHVNDTPNTIGWDNCNNIHGATCMPHAGGEPYDNVQNFMEYSYCSTMFTNGQKARMYAALNSSTGDRDNVVSASNLTNTGVNEPEVFCKANFSSSVIQVCEGGTVTFTDQSYFNPTQWSWTFTGGSPSTSSQQNPVITYTTPGIYTVSLTSGDGTSSDTQTKTGYIMVLPSNGALPVLEGFENYTNIASSNNKWGVENASGSAWEVYSGTGYTGNKCVKISTTAQTTGTVDALISSSYDLSGNSSPVTLSFRTSYKMKQASNTDVLKIYASKDCGQTWGMRKSLSASQMSLGTQISSWTPGAQSDWITTHVTNITSTYFTNSLRLKFEFTYGGGNNIYLDDINLYSGSVDPMSINELSSVVSNFNVFPNPTAGDLSVVLNIPEAVNFEVNVLDLSGKKLQTNSIQGQPGTNNVILNVNNLAQGMYFIEVSAGGGKSIKQFVKQ
jgi:PKD repeat protein